MQLAWNPRLLLWQRGIARFTRDKNPMETLEFIIYPDGRVMEKVTGIVGSSCAEVTAAIEAQLGRVLKVEPTAEYFAQVQQEQETRATQATFSQWQ